MLELRTLQIKQFRNLSNVDLTLGPVNLFWGDNGAGKTSLLEAIYFLGTGRSFRSSQARHLIQHDAESLQIAAELALLDQIIPLGVRRATNGQKQLRFDSETITSFAPIAQMLPLQLMSTLSYRFFTDGPKVRRQFFDWSTFHVDPDFYSTWKQWQHILKQRNAGLKQRRPPHEIQAWDAPLCELASQVDAQRKRITSALVPILKQHLAILSAPFALRLHYDRGWPTEQSLLETLQTTFERDRQLGYTHAGPQRADLQLYCADLPASVVLSQGQQKLAMYAMHLAQGFYLCQQCERRPIYLIDDLASELDPATQETVLRYLIHELNAQIFLTGITKASLQVVPASNVHLFHVQQGQVQSAAVCL